MHRAEDFGDCVARWICVATATQTALCWAFTPRSSTVGKRICTSSTSKLLLPVAPYEIFEQNIEEAAKVVISFFATNLVLLAAPPPSPGVLQGTGGRQGRGNVGAPRALGKGCEVGAAGHAHEAYRGAWRLLWPLLLATCMPLPLPMPMSMPAGRYTTMLQNKMEEHRRTCKKKIRGSNT